MRFVAGRADLRRNMTDLSQHLLYWIVIRLPLARIDGIYPSRKFTRIQTGILKSCRYRKRILQVSWMF